jgi:serine/threonine-protein kinase
MGALNTGSTSADLFGLVGQTVAERFRVDALVAEGGFGLVYRAQQMALARPVALKILKPAADLGPTERADFHRRFEAEAQLVARLKHPHIVQVHDFGVSGSVGGDTLHWMALEWLEGRTLERWLAGTAATTSGQRSPMDAAATMALLRPVFQAVGYAHRHGVAHLDLKPGNIFLADVDGAAVPKVLDFGIAGMKDESQSASGSRVRKSLQTPRGFQPFSPHYAAPEQVSYGRTGTWTDVHALGLLTTELLTGVPPYPEGEPEARLQAIISESRPTPRSKGISAGPWEAVLAKALARRPADRYQNADQLLAALEHDAPRTIEPSAPVNLPGRDPARRRSAVVAALAAVALAAVATAATFALRPHVGPATDQGRNTDRIVLAVLPFQNLTGDPGQEVLGDGLTDGTIGQLGRLLPERLSVIARTSVARYKNTAKGAAEIGRELGVAYLLESTVKRQQEQLRVDAHLVRVSDQTEIWSDSYAHGIEDVAGLQNEMALGVARGIRLKLGARAEMALAHRRPVIPAAYESYLRARYAPPSEGTLAASWRVRVATYQEAVRIDPTFALGYAGLAVALIAQDAVEGGAVALGPKAKTAALRAVELDGGSPQAHAALGAVLFHLYWDWAGAERELRRALELDPNELEALDYHSRLCITVGRFPEAITARTRAIELDPLSTFPRWQLGAAYLWARQYDAAIDQLRRTLAIDDKVAPAHTHLAVAYLQKGMLDAAVEQVTGAPGAPIQAGASPEALSRQGYVLARAGRIREARAVLDMLSEQARVRHVVPLAFARVYLGLGEREETFRWLEKAYHDHDTNLMFLRVDPAWDAVREDPRFIDLVRRVGIPPLVGAQPAAR